MGDKVFFKIILPTFNSMAYIKQCLDSIVNQTFQDYKLIVVDDQSTDLSDKICEMYARRNPSKIIFKRADEKWLAGKCRNWGIDYPLESEYILFIDADDMYNGNDALQKMHDCLKDRPDVLLYNYDVILRSKNAFTMPVYHFTRESDQLANTVFNAAWTKAIKSEKVKKFLEGCMRGEDTYMWLQVLNECPTIKQIKDSLYIYRMHSSNITFSDTFKKDRRFFVDALKKLLPSVKNPWVIASIRKRCGI